MEGPRRAIEDELDQLADLMAICFGGALGPRRRRRRPHWVRRSGAWVIARDGRLVSHIRLVYNFLSIYGCRVKIASIGGVCTHPDYRNQGLASILLEHCALVARQAGASLLLISGGRGMYRRAHAVEAAPTREATLSPRSVRTASPPLRVRPVEPDDWRACARLYQAEPVRFLRSADSFAQVLRHERRDRWIVERQGAPEAYVILSREWGTPPEDPRRNVSEYAGSRGALVDALPSLFEVGQLERITFPAPIYDLELGDLLEGMGEVLRPGTMEGHTIRMISLPTLMQRLKPYLSARLARSELRRLALEQEADRCTFRFGGDRVDLDLASCAALVLGGPEAPRMEGEIGRVLASLLPLAFPMPGMNYV
jgi:GNAT superfamily N-acetyltransferase